MAYIGVCPVWHSHYSVNAAYSRNAPIISGLFLLENFYFFLHNLPREILIRENNFLAVPYTEM
jgi:hypothetical protein